jgi:hypothetical protein
MFTTWKLWGHLLQPVAHPLFARTIKLTLADSRFLSQIFWMAPLAGTLLCCGIWTLFTRLQPHLAVLSLMAIALFSTSFYVIAWIIGISITLIREYEHRTYNQLCLPPSGALGANWAICVANLHRDEALGWVNLIHKLIIGLILFIFMMVLMTAALRQAVFNPFQFIRLLVDVLTVMAASYIDHVQSIVLGSLIGMLVPRYARSNVDARVLPVAIFLVLQALTYLVGLYAALVIVPGVFRAMQLSDWIADIGTPLLSLLAFYLARESLIAGAWWALTYQLNTRPTEFRFWP